MVLLLALVLCLVCELAIQSPVLDSMKFQSASNRILVEYELHEGSREVLWLSRDKVIGLMDSVRHFLERSTTTVLANRSSFDTRIQHALNEFSAAVEIYILRLNALLELIPAISLYCLVFAADGLVRRAVRKAGAGLESAQIYHFCKRLILPTMVWTCFSYLVIPVPISSLVVYPILGMGVPLLIGLSFSRFKKYL